MARAAHIQEPELLKADGERIERQLQEVAVRHYRAFITTAECVKVGPRGLG